MNSKNSRRKDVLSWIFLILFGVIVFLPSTRSLLFQGLMKVGFFNPDIPSISDKKSNFSSLVKAEPLVLSDESGKLINTIDLRGKVVFLNFWATWCGPCRAEMPSIQKLFDKYKDNDKVVFLLVEVEGNKEGAKNFLKKEDLNLPVYYPESSIPVDWQSDQIPFTIVLDKEGAKVFDHDGIADFSKKKFEDFLISLINK